MSRRILAALTAVLAVVGVSAAVPRASADAQPAGRYVVDDRVCPIPAPGEWTCFSVVRRPATAATPGAKLATGSVAPAWTRGPSGGLTPRALATAYNYDPESGGAYQTVAIVDWYDHPSVLADLKAFDHHYGLPAETSSSFRKVNENGNASPLPKADKNASIEIALDVQAVRAVCHLCRILLVEASAPTSDHLAKAENTAARLGATEISNSFGTYENRGHQFPLSLRSAFTHPGIVVTASTGDDGWYGWDFVNAGINDLPAAPSFPSSSPWVVAVGGTKLVLNTAGKRQAEPVWNDNGLDNQVGSVRGRMGATGSGCSTVFDAPSWQRAAPNYAHSGCDGKRFTADVSAVAAPSTGLDIYNTFGGHGWMTVGGTSLSSPLIAAMWALVGGARGVDAPAETLYQNRRYRPNTPYDVVTGGSSWCGGDTIEGCSDYTDRVSGGFTANPNVYQAARVECSYPLFTERPVPGPTRNLSCNAAHGLDGPTGVGTPADRRLFLSPTPVVTIVPPARPITGHEQTYQAKVSDPVPGATPVEYAWWWGDHSAADRTTTGSMTHKYSGQGQFTVKVRFTDSKGQVVTVTKQIAVRN